MQAHRRRPTIRRVRDWDPPTSLRAPRVPLDLAPIARPFYEEDEDEEEKATLARFVPINSEIRAILEDPEQTLAYIRKVQASVPDPDSALDSLVAVYEDRVARLERERVQAVAIVAQANEHHARARETVRPKRETKSVGAIAKLQPHLWKMVYGTICVWGLLQLMLTR
jgi:hypothetical protein